MRKSIRKTAAMLAAGLIWLTGCTLLPQEEQLPDAPVIRQDAASEFTMTYVQRGDLVDSQRFTATYKAVRQERLTFPVGGVRFDKAYVETGDTVKAGQLLMELEQEAIAADVENKRAQIKALDLRIAQAREQREVSREKYEIQLSYMDEEELEDAQTMEEYLRAQDRAIESLERQRALASAELDVMNVSISERQLRAGIDGTVTYLRTFQSRDVTNVTETVAIISDTESSMFVTDANSMELFPEGLQIELTIGGVDYPCTVISAQEANAEEGKVYLKTELSTAELSDGDYGYFTIERARKDNVLYVDKKAVKSMNGKQFVYVQEETGLRGTVEVVTGFEAGGYAEVLSGLSEGDAVILK